MVTLWVILAALETARVTAGVREGQVEHAVVEHAEKLGEK
jgi:hypothetical protein